MSGAKHTRGVITADWMMAGHGRDTRRMETLNIEGRGTIALAYTAEDARRLVACWNACQGLSTEALEAGVVAELINAELSQGPTKIAATLAKLEKTK